MTIQTIFVVGAGQMGSGIAQVSAEAGYNVILHDLNEETVNKALAKIYHFYPGKWEKETFRKRTENNY